MKANHHYYTLLFLLIFTKNILTCPFIIKNSGDHPVIIVDPYNKQATHINSGKETEINPSIPGWRAYFYSEKLDIYVPRQDNPNSFYRRYQLVEKYCTSDKTKLSLSDIAQFVNTPNDRFSVTQYNAHEHKAHTH